MKRSRRRWRRSAADCELGLERHVQGRPGCLRQAPGLIHPFHSYRSLRVSRGRGRSRRCARPRQSVHPPWPDVAREKERARRSGPLRRGRLAHIRYRMGPGRPSATPPRGRMALELGGRRRRRLARRRNGDRPARARREGGRRRSQRRRGAPRVRGGGEVGHEGCSARRVPGCRRTSRCGGPLRCRRLRRQRGLLLRRLHDRQHRLPVLPVLRLLLLPLLLPLGATVDPPRCRRRLLAQRRPQDPRQVADHLGVNRASRPGGWAGRNGAQLGSVPSRACAALSRGPPRAGRRPSAGRSSRPPFPTPAPGRHVICRRRGVRRDIWIRVPAAGGGIINSPAPRAWRA